MVFYLTAKDGTPLYVGKDKYENEDLIKVRREPGTSWASKRPPRRDAAVAVVPG